ncbi:MAG TPA: hypothetical protein VJJ23_04240 [Candidatus Nanoarchaeia archaeon]|nr:hypothetical protein [Candidatus Nanoarchaeia archaeon]
MDRKNIKKSKQRLLLNAEPFGFGPAAAIASFFPYLKKYFNNIGYVGKNHTLDLQRNLNYNLIYDLSKLSSSQEKIKLKKIFSKYDLLLSALDFSIVKQAKKCGLKIIIYDPLTWYWKKIPRTIKKGDIYIAQDFFNVKKRLKKQEKQFPLSFVVPPITQHRIKKIKRSYVLINLGGLQNPYISNKDLVTYAKIMINTIKSIIQNKKIIISTSRVIAKKLKSEGVKNYTRREIISILAKTKYAFMTPGLGNIYDSSCYNIPTIWMPPTNDSQGQQTQLLFQNRMIDGYIDWIDFTGIYINYFKNQKSVLQDIAKVLKIISNDQTIQNNLKEICRNEYINLKFKKGNASQKILNKFGRGGSEKVAKIVYEYAESLY